MSSICFFRRFPSSPSSSSRSEESEILGIADFVMISAARLLSRGLNKIFSFENQRKKERKRREKK
ncbi:MAG: hypothetical protein KHW62_01920 [Clostridiales bacterium]|nr:hypothetical protein [Clostridiales bacterium]